MHIKVVGVDHTTAPIALRERLACTSRQIPQLLQAAREIAQECVVLSTCNRVELYAVCPEESQGCSELLRVLSETREVAFDELEPHCFSFVDQQAVMHLFVVAGKRARSETGISRSATSVSHVAVQLARRLFPAIQDTRVLLIGSGKMSELAARNLCDHGARQLVIINRTLAHAVDLAQALNATHRSFIELPDSLVEADVVISSTTAPHAIITPEIMQTVLERRARRSLLLIDIALPRDVDPIVGAMPGVHLYNVDDLQSEVERGILLRLQEAERVRMIINEEAEAFERWLASLSVVGTISDLRQYVDLLRQQELERTLRQISPSLSTRELAAVQELTTRLVNKLLHTPTLRLKDAAASGQGHVYAEAMRYLFGLENANETNSNRDASQQTRNDTNELGDRATAPAVAQS